MHLVTAGYIDNEGVYHELSVRTEIEDPCGDVIRAARQHATSRGRKVQKVVGFVEERIILWEAQQS